MATRRFRVALSFAGERRDFVKAVADALSRRLGQDQVFFDAYWEAELARPDLDLHLGRIYREDADLVVPFYSADYATKKWCRLEWRQMREVLLQLEGERIMPFRFDGTPVEGALSLDGYVEVRQRTAEEIAGLIMRRLDGSPEGSSIPDGATGAPSEVASTKSLVLFDEAHGQGLWDAMAPTLASGFGWVGARCGEGRTAGTLREGEALNGKSLGPAAVFVLAIGPAGRTTLSEAEIRVLHEHVDRGGGLLVLGTYTGDWHHSANLNRLLEKYGIALCRDVVTNAPDDGFNQRMEFGAQSRAAVTSVPVTNPVGDEALSNAISLVSGVRSVLTISSCSLYVDPAVAVPLLETTEKAVVLEPIPIGVSIRIRGYLPRPCGPVVVAAASRRHRVVVVGGWKTFVDALLSESSSDNGRFWSNVVAWLAGEAVLGAGQADRPGSAPGPEPARKWILVAGSGKGTLPDRFVRTSERLGRELAVAGFGLVSGGWPGVDQTVARAFAGAVRGTKGRLADRLLQVLPEASLPDFPGGRLATEPTEDEAWQRSVRECDAVVLIGGVGGTYTTAEMAWRLGKPVLPIADAREDGHDDSKRAYFHMYRNWSRLGIPGLSQDDFAQVAEPVPEVVADVVLLLRRILGNR